MIISKGVIAAIIFATNAHNMAQVAIGTTMTVMETVDVITSDAPTSNGTWITDISDCFNGKYNPAHDRYDFARNIVEIGCTSLGAPKLSMTGSR